MKITIKNLKGEVIFSTEAADLSSANLSYADLRSADLSSADLRSANLSSANLRSANLSSADLRSANLSSANLSYADLRSANLRYANLSYADLSSANLSSANLRSANLSYADLRSANLSYADLRSANLSYANLRSADLSQVKGLLTAKAWLEQFKRDELGLIVFRSEPGLNPKPACWQFKPCKFLEEVVNPCRADECGSGVHFSTLEWAKKNYKGPYWKCRIRWEDLADVVVPYNTDGKARCARLELLKKVE